MSACLEQLNESLPINVINNSERREIKETPLYIYNKTTQIVHLPGGVKREASLINDNQSFRNHQMKSSQSNKSLSFKITREYRSNVMCLPARNYNSQVRDLDMPNEKSVNKFKDKHDMENSFYNILSNQMPHNSKSNKIVSIHVDKIIDNDSSVSVVRGRESNNKNYHLFNSSSKRLLNMKNLNSGESDSEKKSMKKSISRRDLMTSEKEIRIVSSSKGKKPGEIKNLFSSQIRLN